MSFARSTRRKQKPTRKQEMQGVRRAAESLNELHDAQDLIQRAYFNAYRRAVKQYFSKDLPEGLLKAIHDDIAKAVEAGQSTGSDVDLNPIVDNAVTAFMRAEAEQGGAA